jgi:WD40 repeat protein
VASRRAVVSVAFSPDDKYVVSGSEDGTARVWVAATGQEMAGRSDGGYVTEVEFSPDGKSVLSVYEGFARIWAAATGKELFHKSYGSGANMGAFSPDGKYVVTSSDDDTTQVWETSTGKELARLDGHGRSHMTSAAFSPEGRDVVSSTNDNMVVVWQAVPQQMISRMTTGGFVKSVVFSPDGKYVLSVENTADGSGAAHVWEAATGRAVSQMTRETTDKVFPAGDVLDFIDDKYLAFAKAFDQRLVEIIRVGRLETDEAFIFEVDVVERNFA